MSKEVLAERAQSFLALHQPGSPVVLPTVWDAWSATLAVNAGFAALTTRLLALEQRRAGGTVHVRPEVVVEVRVDGVQTSSLYPGGLALRFARIVGVRDDKRPADADTLDALRRLRDR